MASSSTPKSQYHQHHRPRHSSEWTPEMRDRQARGKNPYSKGEGSEDSDTSDAEPMRLGARHVVESHTERERKGEAMYVLDNPEALMAHAQATGDSITGQRLRFMRQLCGFDEKRQESTPSARSSKNRRVSDRGDR
ncbi:hypothetical protein FALBO_16383 [Fusarium albosuccineum]|uniref:Uncharacterized protein n=2 Tax=Fusarium decemcellulare species complex TaxID=1329916 RepID=A0A8H4KJX9_9HYPO|nr:hypothetical protein FALBO_16383 [Fusarium albosuccineum]KAF4985758.1 hypothetical protein FDECE_16335 [Fusarium decemcellulare]